MKFFQRIVFIYELLRINILIALGIRKPMPSKKFFQENPSLVLAKASRVILHRAMLEKNPKVRKALVELSTELDNQSAELFNLGVVALAFFPDEGTD